MSSYGSYNTPNDILLNGSVLFLTSFTGGIISFIGCSLIYKRMKEQYRITNNRRSTSSSTTTFTFESDQDETQSEYNSKATVTLPDYDDYIQNWVIDRNHNDHKGSDDFIPFDFVEELTSNGLVYLTYLTDQKRFHYWSNNTVNYNILCTVARKYCITYGCVDYYLDGYEEPKSDSDEITEGNSSGKELGKESDTDEDDYLFLKPKSTDNDVDTTTTERDNQVEISEEEEEDEYIEERYGRYGDPRPTTPVPKHLILINKGNLYEWEDIRKREEKKQQMNKWKNAMMNIGDGDDDDVDNIKSDSVDNYMCNSYADFKDMLQAEKKLLDVKGSLVQSKTPTPSPVHLNSTDMSSD